MTSRAMTSVALPAVKGTITRIGFAGQTCARPSVPAAVNTVSAIAAASNRRRDVTLDTVLLAVWFAGWIADQPAIYHAGIPCRRAVRIAAAEQGEQNRRLRRPGHA